MRQGQVQGTESRRAWRCAVLWQKTVLQVFSTEGASVVRKEPWNCRSPGFAECQSCRQSGVAGVCCDPGFLEKWVIFPLHVGLFHHFPFITRAQRLECQFFLIHCLCTESLWRKEGWQGELASVQGLELPVCSPPDLRS